MKYYKRPNYRNNAEDIFYSMNPESRVCVEYQSTTGQIRLLKSGEHLGDLVPIELKALLKNSIRKTKESNEVRKDNFKPLFNIRAFRV